MAMVNAFSRSHCGLAIVLAIVAYILVTKVPAIRSAWAYLTEDNRFAPNVNGFTAALFGYLIGGRWGGGTRILGSRGGVLHRAVVRFAVGDVSLGGQKPARVAVRAVAGGWNARGDALLRFVRALACPLPESAWAALRIRKTNR